MQTTGIFETYQYYIENAKIGKTIDLWPFGDIHLDAPNHATKVFDEWLRDAKAAPDDTIFMGMGDYFDMASTSERRILQSGLHDSTDAFIEKACIESADRFLKKIEFMRGRLVGLIEGNHFQYLPSHGGITTTEYLAQKMGCKYLGVCAIVRLKFAVDTSRTSIDIFAHHGAGGGQTPGGSINRVYKMMGSVLANIYMMGHNHDLTSKPETIIYMDSNGVVKEKRMLLVRTGSFLKAYIPGEKSYIVDIQGKPASLGAPKIHMTPRRDKSKGGAGLYVQLESTT
jgi:hypothetical protein